MKRSVEWALGALMLVAGAGILAQAQYGPPNAGSNWRYNGGPGRWDPSWDQRPNPGRGACFYTDANFGGHHFCVAAGDRIGQLPGGIGNRISSIQTFGNTQVRVFDGQNFRGRHTIFAGTVPDLGRVAGRRGRPWNDSISSVVVQ